MDKQKCRLNMEACKLALLNIRSNYYLIFANETSFILSLDIKIPINCQVSLLTVTIG